MKEKYGILDSFISDSISSYPEGKNKTVLQISIFGLDQQDHDCLRSLIKENSLCYEYRDRSLLYTKRGSKTEETWSIPYSKPPLGLIPKKWHDRKRLQDISEAISRYWQDEREIPLEWVEEYNQLLKFVGENPL